MVIYFQLSKDLFQKINQKGGKMVSFIFVVLAVLSIYALGPEDQMKGILGAGFVCVIYLLSYCRKYLSMLLGPDGDDNSPNEIQSTDDGQTQENTEDENMKINQNSDTQTGRKDENIENKAA
jgi:hypothetical protein